MLNLDKNKRYLLACSYGPDSMALFDLLEREKVAFDVAHVNYHLREESDYEEESLRRYCKHHNKTLFVKNVDEKITKNIEAACREIRYSFFAEIFSTQKYDSLLVAHNEDDLIETYLMQKTRKNLVNYYGIAELSVLKDIQVRRPLLDRSKKQLQLYCDKHNVPYAIDETNLERTFLRNRIRLDIVSGMPFSERMKVLNQIYNENEQLINIKNKIEKTNNNISELLSLSEIEFAYYLGAKIETINPSFMLTHKCVIEVVELMKSPKPNICLNVGNKLLIKKEYDKLFVELFVDKESGFEFVIEKPCQLDNEYFYFDFRTDPSNRNISQNDYPLTIRTYRDGDTYQIKDYVVKVRRLFIDWKIPMSLRKRWPIILNKDNKIVYIPRYREDFVPNRDTNFYVK